MDLASKTLSELKTRAAELGVDPTGDRRLKQTWILAIEAATGDRVTEPIEVQPTEAHEVQLTEAHEVQPQEPILQLPETSPGVETDRPFEPGIKLSDRFLSLYAPPNFSRAHEAEPDGLLKLLERVTDPEPPDPDHYSTLQQFWAVMNAWNATYTDVEQFRDLDIQQQNNAELSRTDTQQIGTDESAIGPGIHQQCLDTPEPDGGSGRHKTEALGGQERDRILAAARDSQTVERRPLPHQPTELTETPIATLQAPIAALQAPIAALQAPIAALQAPNTTLQAPNTTLQAPNTTLQAPISAFNDPQPPNRGEGRRGGSSKAQLTPPPHLKPGTEVGHKSNFAHLGPIEKIYFSHKRRKWRAKVGPANYDLDNLVEQKVQPWDEPEIAGNWVKTGFTMRRHEACDIWTHRLPVKRSSIENWTATELTAKPIWQVKAIADRQRHQASFSSGSQQARVGCRSSRRANPARTSANSPDSREPQTNSRGCTIDRTNSAV